MMQVQLVAVTSLYLLSLLSIKLHSQPFMGKGRQLPPTATYRSASGELLNIGGV